MAVDEAHGPALGAEARIEAEDLFPSVQEDEVVGVVGQGDLADGLAAQGTAAGVHEGAVGGDAGGGLEADEVCEKEAGGVGNVTGIVDQQNRAGQRVAIAPGSGAGEAAEGLVIGPKVRTRL